MASPNPNPSLQPPSFGSISTNGAIFGQCELQLQDFQHAVRHEPKTRQLLRLANRMSAAGLLTALGLGTTGHFQPAFAAGVASLLLLALHQLPDMQALRWFRRTPAQARAMRYTINRLGLIVVSDQSQRMYPWRELYAFEQTASILLIWVSAKMFLIVPQRAFRVEDRGRVSQQCLENIGTTMPSQGLGLRWLLLLAAAVAAWFLWQCLAPRTLQR